MHGTAPRQSLIRRLAMALALRAGATALLAATPLPVLAQPADEAIVPDEEFERAIPPLPAEDDPQLAEPLESIQAFERRVAAEQAAGLRDAATPFDVELIRPLPPLETFQVRPDSVASAETDPVASELAYRLQLSGLGSADDGTEVSLLGRFNAASALRQHKGKAANLAQVASRTSEDVLLLQRLLAAQGWFDAQVTSRIDRTTEDGDTPLTVVIEVTPGKRFVFNRIGVAAAPTEPPGLIETALGLQPDKPVIAEEVIAAEGKVAIALPERGYAFAEIGQRDLLLDPETGGANYTLPVTVGPRGVFGGFASEGTEAFDARHIGVLARFRPGEPYDSRKVDDLRQALVATGLFRAVAVEPRRTGRAGPDGTEVVDLGVRQEAGPPRVIAASLGHSTGEGYRAEASWTHRNLFRPEGALILGGRAGTREQGANATFRRSNAGQRDRSLELAADLLHSRYEAFSAYTGRLSFRLSRDSTPLWQKRLTYAVGAQLIGTNESVFDPLRSARTRRTYAIAALSGQLGLDTSDSLLDPTAGFRLTALAEPEGSLRRDFSPYLRFRLDGSAYRRLGDGLVVAGRMRLATIQGAGLDELAPSRRFYAGGGGSVRGFGYQQLGPQTPNGRPSGGRSLNEAGLELRYRFGDYGVVAFADAGQAYASTLPRFRNLRAGAGIGGRLYTNFGPMRIDLATPLRRKRGEHRLNVYASIGQAF